MSGTSTFDDDDDVAADDDDGDVSNAMEILCSILNFWFRPSNQPTNQPPDTLSLNFACWCVPTVNQNTQAVYDVCVWWNWVVNYTV